MKKSCLTRRLVVTRTQPQRNTLQAAETLGEKASLEGQIQTAEGRLSQLRDQLQGAELEIASAAAGKAELQKSTLALRKQVRGNPRAEQ